MITEMVLIKRPFIIFWCFSFLSLLFVAFSRILHVHRKYFSRGGRPCQANIFTTKRGYWEVVLFEILLSHVWICCYTVECVQQKLHCVYEIGTARKYVDVCWSGRICTKQCKFFENCTMVYHLAMNLSVRYGDVRKTKHFQFKEDSLTLTSSLWLLYRLLLKVSVITAILVTLLLMMCLWWKEFAQVNSRLRK